LLLPSAKSLIWHADKGCNCSPHDGLASCLGQYQPVRTFNMLRNRRNGPCWLRENIIIIIKQIGLTIL